MGKLNILSILNLGRGKIGTRITAIYIENILLLVILFFIITGIYYFFNFDDKFTLKERYEAQNVAAIKVQNLLNQSAVDIMKILYKKHDDSISILLARNEDIFHTFDTFRSTAEEYNIIEDISFAKENEFLILEIRKNIVTCINLYRDKKIKKAIAFYYVHIEKYLNNINQFVEDTIYSKTIAIESVKKEIDKAEMILAIVIIISFVIVIIINIIFGNYIKSSITKPLKEIMQVTAEIGDGDLRNKKIDNKYNDEISELITSVDKMNSKLYDIIKRIDDMVNVLIGASEQINATSQDLSQSTNEQAANVEEISASIEEMSAITSQNLDSAKSTDEIAQKSAHEMEDGSKAVKETVNAIKTIIKKVSKIEDIANQINILAINAAIEAARAGDYGNGFAVVAGEVRKLAEISQDVTQEINELSDYSIQVSGSTENILTEIAPSIKKTAEMIQDIYNASEQHMQGIKQINIGIEEINLVSQNNASTSEELAATAEMVRKNASEIQDLISFFKLTDKETQ